MVNAALALAFSLPLPVLGADVLFQSADRVDGREVWSPPRKYANPAEVARARSRVEDVRVTITGLITPQDVESVLVMANLVRSGKHKFVGNVVSFASNGGDIDAALEIGRILRGLGAFTHVAADDQCISACVFAFMGGERRSVAGKIGIHRPYFPFTQDFPDRKAKFRHLQRTLKAYIEEMDFPDSLYEAVMLVPPETMQIVSPADLKRFYLDGISPSSEDAADAAAARRLDLPMVEYLRHKARTSVATSPAGTGRSDQTAAGSAK